MRHKKILWLSSVVILLLAVLYAVFVFQLPQLIRISQTLGIGLSWHAFREYLERDLIGMTRDDVNSLLKELYPNMGIQKLRSTPDCEYEYIQMGDGFNYFSYILCYRDNRLVSVELGS